MQPNIWVTGVPQVGWGVIMVKSHPRSSMNLTHKEHEKKIKSYQNEITIIE